MASSPLRVGVIGCGFFAENHLAASQTLARTTASMLEVARNLPTIVQKPLAPTWKDCVAIVETCRAARIPFMVHENTRFLTPVRKAREIIDSGAIGRPTWARVSFRTGHNIYGKQPYLAQSIISPSSTLAFTCSMSLGF